MSKYHFKKARDLKNRSPDRSYEVGYGKPPVATRFAKGQAGNPAGRPKGAKNRKPALHEERLRDIIITEAYRTIKMKDGTKNVSVPMAQAVVRSIAVNAVRGDQRSQKIFTDLVNTTEAKNRKLYDQYLQTMMEYKYSWEAIIEDHKNMGLEPPVPIPHPDHISINFATGVVQVKGPLTKEQQEQWTKLRKRKAHAAMAIREYELEQLKTNDPQYTRFLQEEIEHEQRIYDFIANVIPEG